VLSVDLVLAGGCAALIVLFGLSVVPALERRRHRIVFALIVGLALAFCGLMYFGSNAEVLA
jgi:hypothetical protein